MLTTSTPALTAKASMKPCSSGWPRAAAAIAALDELLALAHAQGRSRADAGGRDVLLLFAATRAARAVDSEGWRRVLELFIDALAAQPRVPADVSPAHVTN
jgi:hypothetical protein